MGRIKTTIASDDGSVVVFKASSAGFSEYAVFSQHSEQIETLTEVDTDDGDDLPTEVDTTGTEEPASEELTAAGGPGFTVVMSLLAVLVATVLARRRS